jgi:hypothetical protein
VTQSFASVRLSKTTVLAPETKLGYRKISLAVTWVYQNKNLPEELGIYYSICPNEL